MTSGRRAALVVGGLVLLSVASVVAAPHVMNDETPCASSFYRMGTRCCPTPAPAPKGLCGIREINTCPSPLVATQRGCDEPKTSIVDVPETTITLGPSDWEAEGRVRPRTIHVGAFRIDRFEVSIGRAHCTLCPLADPRRFDPADLARAASGIDHESAARYCAAREGRLPTEDEWIVAASGPRALRYPWGDTGAVCLRAAWGLADGPCGSGAVGPDTVGAHGDGQTPTGIHDLAGNVAEWVDSPGGGCAAGGVCTAVVRGGSYRSALATELRTWDRREMPRSSREPWIGFRCAYDVRVGSSAP